MNVIELPYGRSSLALPVPETAHLEWITPPVVDPAANPVENVQAALDCPVGPVRLSDFTGARSAIVAINDKTRPVPHQYLLPPLLSRLEAFGIPPQSILLLIATGTHMPMHPEEYPRILPPEIIARYRVVSHDCDDSANLVDRGTTTRGTPIFINRLFDQADLRIAVGNIEPHHFMGFSGGAKTAAIGVSGRQTINTNHAMLVHPNAITGHYTDNPMRQDVEEIGEKIGLHFVLNAVLNLNKQIVQAIAGNPRAVMAAGIPISQQICQVRVSHPYDLVIASAGGYPKDINFYQSQKALTHAAMITRDGGTLILVAASPEGIGSRAYEQYVAGKKSHQEVLQRFASEGFQVGPHKAFQVARIASRVRVLLASEMADETVQKLLLIPVKSSEAVFEKMRAALPEAGRIAVMPYAVGTVPLL
jgi:nickel-dependent lactate racemase